MILHYILNERGEPVAEPDDFKWGMWMASRRHRVLKTIVGNAFTQHTVSTIFTGLDHALPGEPPVLWETRVCGEGPLEGVMDRCGGSREQAEAMHREMVARVRKELL